MMAGQLWRFARNPHCMIIEISTYISKATKTQPFHFWKQK